MKKCIPELYGSLVFNDKIMKNKLPGDVYKALRKTIETGSHLELDVANAVAVAMKEWAVENGATHFTHWFQLHQPGREWRNNHGFLRKRAGQGRT